MKKIVAVGLLILSVVANASWWGDLDGGVRAAIVGGSALLLNRLDTQIRRDYERQAVAQNAHYKYGNSGVPARLQTATANNYSGRNSNYNNGNYSNQRSGKVVYSDGRTQIIELSDGTRITLNQ